MFQIYLLIELLFKYLYHIIIQIIRLCSNYLNSLYIILYLIYKYILDQSIYIVGNYIPFLIEYEKVNNKKDCIAFFFCYLHPLLLSYL